METYIAYFDETGDDGANTSSSNQFVLTSIYMSADAWQINFDIIRAARKELKQKSPVPQILPPAVFPLQPVSVKKSAQKRH